MLSAILPAVAADPAISAALSQTANRDLAMPRGLVPPVLALMGQDESSRSPLIVAVTPTGREAD